MVDLVRTGRFTAYAGALAQLVGLSWDVVLHRLDPALAESEGVFTLTNPGHALFAGGLALVVVGLGLMVLAAGGRRGRLLRAGSAGVLGVLALATVALAATSEGGLTGHSHSTGEVHVHDDGAVHTHNEHEAFVQNQGQSQASAGAHAHEQGVSGFGAFGDIEESRHQHQPDIPIQAADLPTLQEQLAAARAATEQYQDVRVALRAGYIQVTQDLPGIAAHFAHPLYSADGAFDPARPEILLYAKLDDQWKLVGLSYLSPFTGAQTPPEGFAGPLDAWHYHTDICFAGQRVVAAGKSRAECAQMGGRFTANTGWMMHLWLYYDSPEGLFAHENSLLKGSGAVLTRAELAAMQ